VRVRSALTALACGVVMLGISAEAAGAGHRPAAAITFCAKVGKSSGTLYGVADSFPLKEEDRVTGVVDLTDCRPGEMLVFHILWLRPDGRGAFLKRVEIVPDGPEARIESSLSLSPKRRDPGTYHLKVYLFRMLLAEKPVEFVGEGAGEEESAEREP
jgi:hypothetical protein